MSAPTITALTDPVSWMVSCPEHGLQRIVDTERHAENLLALHLRLDHPADPRNGSLEVDLRRAALTVVNALDGTDLPHHYAIGILILWESLTGLDEEASQALARQLADSPAPVIAHVAPF